MVTLAVNGGTPLRTKPWPRWPVVDDPERQALLSVLESRQWGRLNGAIARDFEARFAAYQGARHGLAVSSGTAALEVAVRAAGIGPGDEVIVPPYSFMATATAVLQMGAVPVFVDIEAETYNLDPALLERAVTPRTRAILPVHFGGRAADMGAVLDVARRHGLVVIEDTAHGHGGRWRDRGLGTVGDLGAFSFQASKNLTSGEGGVVLTDDAALYAQCVGLHDLWRGGVQREAIAEGFPLVSWNYRLGELQAALLLAGLARLEAETQRRADNAAHLTHRLAEIGGIRTLRADPFVTRNACHIYIFRYTGDARDSGATGAGFAGLPRERFLEALRAEGIPANPGYTRALHEHPMFRHPARALGEKAYAAFSHAYGQPLGFRDVHCPVAERLCRTETVWLSQSLFLGDAADMDDVADAILKIRDHAEELRASP
jgi:dTDP-4-amino-4,6-dideoxygalactose transaminase